MHFGMFFSIILLRKISPGKSYQNQFKFTTWIHCIIPIYMLHRLQPPSDRSRKPNLKLHANQADARSKDNQSLDS